MKSVLLIIFILSAQISVAQHLTFSDLLTLHESNIEKSDLLLTNRGFIFSESINQDDKTVSTGWLFKRSGNLKSSNEYFYKDCKGSKCDRVQYFISDANCFNSLKENAKKNGAKYMFTDSDAKVGLSFYYLFKGPTEIKFTSLPSSAIENVQLFVITLKEMKVE